MKYFVISILVIGFSICALGQSIKLTGTVYDSNGAIVVGADVKVVSADKKQFSTRSIYDGSFLLELFPGLYGLEFTSAGFETKVLGDYQILDSANGTMNLEVVLVASNDHEPCGYGGGAECIILASIEKYEAPLPSDKTTPRPRREENKNEYVGKTRYCMTVTDDVGAFIPNASVSFSPTKRTRSRIKYEFKTDEEGAVDVNVLDGIYNISVKASTYKKIVLKNQLLPYDPRTCITVRLKTTIPPHQIT